MNKYLIAGILAVESSSSIWGLKGLKNKKVEGVTISFEAEIEDEDSSESVLVFCAVHEGTTTYWKIEHYESSDGHESINWHTIKEVKAKTKTVTTWE